MELKYGIVGTCRKVFVQEISTFLDIPSVYLRTPSCAYQIGECIVTREGNLQIPDSTDNEAIKALAAYLSEKGYYAEVNIEPEQTAEIPEEPVQEEVQTNTTDTGLTIEIPLDCTSVGNLVLLLEAKGNLIKQALGISELPIEIRETTIAFPWFSELPQSDEVKAYTEFITALANMAKQAKRVTAREKAVDNPKYAFRCFLLRLGFIGDKYKKTRKILLKNLSGSSAFKSGAKQGGDEA